MFKTIYLTGAPASGKSTAVDLLSRSGKPLQIWSYSDRLQQYMAERDRSITHEEMRRRSSSLITAEDISAVDDQLISFVAEHRSSTNLIIDSHPATRESYGFRVTAFSVQQIAALAPDEIWMTFASPSQTMYRISADAQGRPGVNAEEAAMHTSIQAAVATTYGIVTGRPVYFFDSNVSAAAQADRMAKRLRFNELGDV